VQTSNGALELRTVLARDAAYDVTTSNGTVTAVLKDRIGAPDLPTLNGETRLKTEVTVLGIQRQRMVGPPGQGSAFLRIRTANG